MFSLKNVSYFWLRVTSFSFQSRVQVRSVAAMAFDAKSRALTDFLQKQADSAPELAADYAQMTDLFQRKLWHQLTLKLDDFVKLPAAASHLQPLYETFVVDFKHRLNKLALARVQVAVAKQLGDIAQQAFFCKTAAEEAAKDDRQARAFLLCELGRHAPGGGPGG